MGANGCFEAMNSNQSMTGYGQVSDRQHATPSGRSHSAIADACSAAEFTFAMAKPCVSTPFMADDLEPPMTTLAHQRCHKELGHDIVSASHHSVDRMPFLC